MKYLPAENIVYKTKLKEHEVINRLSNYIEEEKLIRFGLFGGSISKAYEGEISKESFDIKRIIGYRNSFLPRINGIIEKDFDGTAIKVKMRLHILVVVFLCIWCGGVGLASKSLELLENVACMRVRDARGGSAQIQPASMFPLRRLYALG